MRARHVLGRGLTRRLAALAACALMAAALPAFAAAAPRRGDWEASGGQGARASFAIERLRQRVHGRIRERLAVEDLVVDAPIQCSNPATAVPPYQLGVISAAVPLDRNGSFAAGRLRHGVGTLVRGVLRGGGYRITYEHVSRSLNQFDGSSEVCRTGRVLLAARPGDRGSVDDGVFLGSSQAGEPVELDVAAGGRALITRQVGGRSEYSFQLRPASTYDDCPGVVSGGQAGGDGTETGGGQGAAFQITQGMFISPQGTFDNGELQYGDSPSVSGRFISAGRATGQFSNPSQGCSWSWTARLSR
jgi:hypothetical protein